jgi:RNA polymerase sigma-70 factor, ECF subfamily
MSAAAAPERAESAPADSGAYRPAASPTDGFEALLGRVLGRALGTALRLTRNREDAEDLVQEAALRAFRSFATFQAGTNFSAWYFRILMNCFYARSRKARPESSLDGLDDGRETCRHEHAAVDELHAFGTDPASLTGAAITVECVTAALEALPDEFRVVCTLYLMDDFAYQEIADVLGVPLGTVRSRLHRGRRMLQKSLWRLADDQGFLTGRKRYAVEELR